MRLVGAAGLGWLLGASCSSSNFLQCRHVAAQYFSINEAKMAFYCLGNPGTDWLDRLGVLDCSFMRSLVRILVIRITVSKAKLETKSTGL